MNLVYSKYRNIKEGDSVMPSKQEIKNAKNEHGKDVVETVLEIVYMSDPDTAYCAFADLDMHNHIVCLEQLYFGT